VLRWARLASPDVMEPAARRSVRMFLTPSLVWCSFALTGCEHSSAFQPDPSQPAPPFSALLPRRLTFNLGDDRTPAWLADGSGIVYSMERLDHPDHDRCLAVLPREGGTIRSSYCQLDPVHDDSTDLMEAPAVSRNGRLFFHRVVSWVGQQKLGASALMLGSADDPVHAAILRPLPYTASNGRLHATVRTPQWIGSDTLVYLAEQLFYEGSTFYPDTFTTGLDVVLLDLSAGEPRFDVVPGTDYASGVDVGDDGTALYYTLGGDSRVFRRELASGIVTSVYDFGPGNIVRDAQVSGSTLVGVVGRSVLYRFEEAHGFVQRDEGGDLVLVDLTTGETARFSTDTVLFRHPAVSPDGTRIVVETQPFDTVHHQVVSEFTAPNHRADLWLFGLEL
jgi:WD40-like Beta Propeller Repeat